MMCCGWDLCTELGKTRKNQQMAGDLMNFDKIEKFKIHHSMVNKYAWSKYENFTSKYMNGSKS